MKSRRLNQGAISSASSTRGLAAGNETTDPSSAAEAKEMGFLTSKDRITFNHDQIIFDARQMVLAMNLTGFRPTRPRTFRVDGTAAFASINTGNVPANSRVSEQ